ncbi:MAG: YdcF family protein [Agathobacter sp.]|nr:YdcF family protein [Agathobacter sp.]
MKEKSEKKKTNKQLIGKIARIVGVVFGIICFMWFGAPYTAAGIWNIGNVTGIILSVLLVVYAVFAPLIHKWIVKLWSKRKAKLPMAITGGLVIICATLVVIETSCMVGACVKAHTSNATAIVLGCRVYGERASLSLVERLEAAYDYLIENPYADCVVSGGQGPGEDISEAECMYRWLVDKGIDSSRIYKEDKSTSTEENIAYSKEVIEENGLFQKVVIITNEYHIYRAGVIADKNGFVWGAEPASTAAWMFPTYYVRELYAILAEWIF